MRQKNESGFIFISFALFIAIFLSALMFYTMDKTSRTADRLGASLSLNFANDISVKIGQKIRSAYDRAQVAGLCTGTGAQIISLNASIKLCLVNKQVCVAHPYSNQNVCVSTANQSLVARHHAPSWVDRVAQEIWIQPAQAQAADVPADPVATDTSNSLSAAPTCIGGACGASCTVDADCVSFRFCPKASGACVANEMVWQTIALLK